MQLVFIGLAAFFFNGYAQAKSIVSLSLASDEILLDLAKEADGFDSIAAVSTMADDQTHSNVTALAKQVKNRVHSEPESVLALKPTTVIAASFNRPELLQLIQKTKADTIILRNFDTLADIEKNIADIGALTTWPKVVKAYSDQFKSRVAGLKTKSSYKFITFGLDLRVMAGDTLFDDLLTKMGWDNLAKTKLKLKKWPKIDVEALSTISPDYIIVFAEKNEREQITKKLLATPGWKNLKAVEQNRILLVPSRLAMATSPYILQAADELVSQVKP
jgi:iron complex transport system substrate-binding protein